jgi:probable HAF family extracellular repeat protein
VRRAFDLSTAGQVVGRSSVAAAGHAFLYARRSGMKNLDAMGGANSHGFGINAGGRVVGSVQTTFAGFHAFLYNSVTGRMIDLDSLIDPAAGWTLTCARAINDSGQVAGHGTAPDGTVRAFLLTPPATQQRAE